MSEALKRLTKAADELLKQVKQALEGDTRHWDLMDAWNIERELYDRVARAEANDRPSLVDRINAIQREEFNDAKRAIADLEAKESE